MVRRCVVEFIEGSGWLARQAEAEAGADEGVVGRAVETPPDEEIDLHRVGQQERQSPIDRDARRGVTARPSIAEHLEKRTEAIRHTHSKRQRVQQGGLPVVLVR